MCTTYEEKMGIGRQGCHHYRKADRDKEIEIVTETY